jgi:sarcosine oxidase subunit beta
LPERNASVAIIGGGIIGASVAYNLAKIHSVKDVLVLEKSNIGSGATRASLGGFRHQFSSELAIKLSIESIRIIEEFEQLFGYDPLVRHDGYVFIASKEQSIAELKTNQKIAKSLGVKVDFLERDELARRFPFYSFEDTIGGTYCSEDGHASTLAVLQGYVSKAKELGVKFLENSEVVKIQQDTSKVTGLLTSDGSTTHASKILIAGGAYSGSIGKLASVNIPIQPYPRKVLVTHNFFDGIPKEIPIIVDVDSTLAIGREGNGIIFADNEPTKPSFEINFPPSYDERIIAKAVLKVPSLSKATISYSNSGLYEMTPDASPIISAFDRVEGLFCCAGFAGHGFMHAPSVGVLASEMIMGSKPHLDISAYGIGRFEDDAKSLKTREQLII